MEAYSCCSVDKVKFKEVVNKVKEGRSTAASVAREFKISYMTYFRWAKGLEKENAHRK